MDRLWAKDLSDTGKKQSSAEKIIINMVGDKLNNPFVSIPRKIVSFVS